MTTAIVGTAASGGAAAAAAAMQVQPKAAAPAATTATAAEDSVTISATAQEVQQSTAVQVRLLRNEGQSVPQIATQLKLTASAVQSYLGAQAGAQK
jgi:DNA-binding NarL/FixJ family response regulator